MGRPCCDRFRGDEPRPSAASTPDRPAGDVSPSPGSPAGSIRPADIPSPSAGRILTELDSRDLIAYGAAPVFAAMAVVTAIGEDEAMAAICATGPVPFLSGMVTMYLLMAVFHLGPWLGLLRAKG